MRIVCAAAHVAPLIVCLGGGAHAAPPRCTGTLGRDDVVRCALATSLDVQQARLALKDVAARRIAAGLWLPSNPVVSGSVEGSATHPPGAVVSSPAVEWQVTIAQEIEIGGQRWARLSANDAEAAAQSRRLAVVEQEVTAAALRSYVELVTTRASLALAGELEQSVEALARFSEEREKEALIAPVDAHLIRAEAVRVGLSRVEAGRRVDVARAALALLLGHDVPDVDVRGDDLPVPRAPAPLPALVARALAVRGELPAAEAERSYAAQQLAAYRRSRVPNVTLSAFTGTNVLGEQVVGGTLSLPMPLPSPLGHTYAAEIAAARARREQADVTLDQVRRRVRLEVAQAFATERARAAALALYPPALVEQARADLRALRDGLAARQLSAREALISERALIELLLGQVEARLAYALAWIDLERAVGALTPEVRR